MPSYILLMFVFLLLISVIKVESNYYAYTYDDGIDDDNEHCCLVRLDEEFCLAKPLTRSLLQVNKQCQQLDATKNKQNYLNKIVRRLNVESSNKVGDKILLELKKPIEKSILNQDLLCLATNNNNINLEKCYVELIPIKQKKSKQKNQNETVVENESNNENKVQQIEITEPVLIRKGRGLSVHETYELNLTDFHATTRKQRDCWSWYRKNTKDILNYPTKSQKTCISLNNQQEKCLEQLFYKKINDNQEEPYEKNLIKPGSKLYCQNNNNKQTKLLGIHRHSEICFITHYQIYIDHKFTDFVSLSDVNKNKDVLEYLANNTKLTNEFESDCNDKNTLANIKKQLEEEEKAEANTVDDDKDDDVDDNNKN